MNARRWLAATLAIGCAAVLAAVDAPGGDDAARLERARRVFQDNCGMCHGYDGVPTLPETPNFSRGERLEKSDETLLQTIRHGKGNMPAWQGRLSDAEQRAALGYARLVGGDVEFRDHCAACHREGIPALPAAAADRAGSAIAGGAPVEVCTGSAVESEMEDPELAAVVRFLSAVHSLPGPGGDGH